MEVELLFVEGCSNHHPAKLLLAAVLAECGSDAAIDEVEVVDADDARSKRFPGSPTIRIDGVDVDPPDEAPPRPGLHPHGVTCRIYRGPGRASGMPARDLVVAAVKRAIANERAGDAR